MLQRAVRSAAGGAAASALVRHLPRRLRSDGLETVNVRTSRGTTVPVTTPYYREKHARRATRRPGLYPALVVLGIYDRCPPKLASDARRAVAMLSSLAEASAQRRSDGIALDIKTLRSTAYRYAARARAAQQRAACGLLDRVTGKRVVVSLDGGRVRVRRKKRGPKTKKGRNRFHTDGKAPKLRILYVVGDAGRPAQTWAPIIDGTLRGPEAVFALLGNGKEKRTPHHFASAFSRRRDGDGGGREVTGWPMDAAVAVDAKTRPRAVSSSDSGRRGECRSRACVASSRCDISCTVRVEAGAVAEHGAGDVEQAVGH